MRPPSFRDAHDAPQRTTFPPLLAQTLVLLALAGVLPERVTAAFTAYTLGANYSPRVSPGKYAGTGPMQIHVRLRIMDILKVSQFESEMSLDILLHRYWREPRLEFTAEAHPGRQYPVEMADKERFWKPDLYVLGMREFHTMNGAMGIDHLILSYDKRIEQLLRATLTLRCQFDFRLFPLDSQECKIDFMCPTLSMEELELGWYPSGLPVSFHLRPRPLELSMSEYAVRLVPCPTDFSVLGLGGNVSALRVWVVLHRHALSHVLEIYLPTGLFVIISWGAFLVKPEVVPGRMVLLVTNLLSLVTIFEASRTTAPPATGLKALDVWLLTCIIFLFFALLEYALILMQLRGRLCRRRPRRAAERPLKLFVAPTPPPPSAATPTQPSAPPQPPPLPGQAGAELDTDHTSTRHELHGTQPEAIAQFRRLAFHYTRGFAAPNTKMRHSAAVRQAVSAASHVLRKFRSRIRRFTWTQWLSAPHESSWCLLDQLSIIAFPLAFLLFNLAYWGTYMRASTSNLQSTTCISRET